jgi:hypothetical protein
LIDRLAGKKADAVRLPGLQLSCADKALDDPMLTLQQLHESVWQPHLGSAAGGAGLGSSVQGEVAAAAAAVTGVGQDGSTAELQAASGDRVMLLYYSI